MSSTTRSDQGFAVLDVETTGLRVGFHHRIVEIAVVNADPTGRVTDRWCTLLNPNRDMGPQHIHGISSAEVRHAPTFTDMAGDIIERLRGRVLVGHNVGFDLMHVRAETTRAEIPVAWDTVPDLCTMQLAGQYVPAAGRSLSAVSHALGLDPFTAHTAIGDAEATAALLQVYLDRGLRRGRGLDDLEACAVNWPTLPHGLRTPVLRRDRGRVDPHWLTRVIDRLPRSEDPHVNTYLTVLDGVLLDRYVSEDEAEQLIELAYELGLHRSDAIALHQGYLHSVAHQALADSVVTPAERHDLLRLAAVLGLPASEVDVALEHPYGALESWEFVPAPRLRLRPGDLVVLTGQMTIPRTDWQARLCAAGISSGAGVTRNTRLLVAADLDSASGKAKKARAYDIPIVSESDLNLLLTELEEAFC